MRQRHGTVGVVSAVEKREVLAVSVQKLVPAGPLRLLDTLSHRFGGETELPPDGHRYGQVRSDECHARVGEGGAGNGLGCAERNESSPYLGHALFDDGARL